MRHRKFPYVLFVILIFAIAGIGEVNAITATGGTITTFGNYTIHTFTSNGTFNVTGSGNVEYLIVAGGGGGGQDTSGGGGAGGLIYNGNYAATAGNITVTVGAGGSKEVLGFHSQNGGNSVFGTLTAIGGGGGGGQHYGRPAGSNGGSGGGASMSDIAGTGTAGQGNNGGVGYSPGGGGGGAGAVGLSNGNGGNGLSIWGTYYAGGGAGADSGTKTGGLGGGGTDGAVNGIANTGGGGGGGYGAWGAGGNGGSGIVIVRYLTYATPSVSINSPANGATPNSSSVTLNWTPSNFVSNPTCNVTRQQLPSGSAIDFTNASDYLQENSTNGTEISNGAVKLHSSASSENVSCSNILSKNPSSPSGTYWISPGGLAPFQVYCDMTTNGGGWTLVANKVSGVATATTGAYIAPGNSNLAITDARWQALSNISTEFIGISGSSWVVFDMARLKNANCVPLSNSLTAPFIAHSENSGCSGIGSDYCIVGWDINANTYMYWECTGALRFYLNSTMPVTDLAWAPSTNSFYVRGGTVTSASYPTSQPYYITTSGNSQLITSGWSGISSFSINQTTPASTSLKYLISFDNRNTWKYYSSGWQTASGGLNDLQAYGMGNSTLQSLTQAQWNSAGGFSAGTLDFAVDLSSANPSVTPELDRISVTPVSTIFSGTCTNNQSCTTTSSTSNGIYSWSATCYAGGDSATSETRNFTVNVTEDTAPPQVTIVSPSSGTKTPIQAQTFSCNAADSAGLSNITLKIWNSLNSLIYSNTSLVSGTSNSSSWDYTFAQRGNYTWNCLATDNSSNFAYSASNATITIQKPIAISILSPADGSGISRGQDDVDDMLGKVADNMSIIARATEEGGQGISGITCSISIDGTFNSSATTNSTGYCSFSYNKAYDSFGIHSISINQSSIPSDYYASNPGISSSFSLDNWSMYIDVSNYRSGGMLFYYVDDIAGVRVSVKKNGVPANVANFSVLLTNQLDQALRTLTLSNFAYLGTGEYKSEIVVPQSSYIRWKGVAMSDFSGQDSNATSSLHTDIQVNSSSTVALNMSMVGSDNQPLANSFISLYRIGELGKYSIFNQTINSSTQSIQKSIIQNDSNYELVITTPQNYSISLLGINLSTASSNFATQQANFSDAKPNQTRYVSSVLASNATGFSISTLTFVKTFEPTSICSCQNWSFASSNCSGVWVCNSTSAYDYSSNSTHFWFNVTHFTGYAIGQSENENLTIWDETDAGMQYGNQIRHINQNVRFFANYSNSSSEPITGADCKIWFLDSGWNAMNWNSTNFYEYTRSFSSGGSFDWNVSCNKSGQTTLTTNDTVLVNSTIDVVLNSPADNAIVKSAVITFNWTPYGFPGDPSCNITRNGSLVHISSCTNNEPCTFANTTANGHYIWNITCNSGATTRESSTRALTVNTLYHSIAVEGTLNMNITEISSISLPQSAINFGTVEITQTYDSYPSQFFVIKNDGNTIVDIEVNATNPFLSSSCSSLPCSAYQVKVGENETIPYPSCSSNPSKESYTNMFGSSSGLLINDFNFVDNDDSANVYIKFRLPNDEPPGSKPSTVTFWAKSAGSYSCN